MTAPVDPRRLDTLGLRVSTRPCVTLTFAELSAPDPLYLLEDYPKAGFVFARFRDQIVDAERGGAFYEVFGFGEHGALAVSESGAVVILVEHDGSFDTDEVPVNRSFRDFVDCYCLFLRAVFTVKPTVGTEGYYATCGTAAAEFTDAVRAIDAHALDGGTYWGQLAYELDDGLFPTAHPPLSDEYLRRLPPR